MGKEGGLGQIQILMLLTRDLVACLCPPPLPLPHHSPRTNLPPHPACADALRGADALYYAPEHAAAVNSAPAGGRAGANSSSVNVENTGELACTAEA